jgi:hypothetical protein
MNEPNPRDETELAELISSIDVTAPPELHGRVQAMIDETEARRSPAARHPTAFRLGTSGLALAVVLIALVLAFGGSGSEGLGVRQTATLALSGATMGAPAENPSARAQLAAAVEGIPFPYWREKFGWRSSGSRLDRRDGRSIQTVFYSDAAGRRVGYAIVGGRPAPSVGRGEVRWLSGTPYHLTTVAGASVVSWVRDGHLCVVSGRGVSPETLLALASWHERPSAT